MGIYIAGMDMPTGNLGLRTTHIYADGVVTNYAEETIGKAIPVTSHGRLIDADALCKLCDIMADKCDGVAESIWHQFRTTVELTPTIIPAEDAAPEDAEGGSIK